MHIKSASMQNMSGADQVCILLISRFDPCIIVKHRICGHNNSTAMETMNPNHEQIIGSHVKSASLDRILASLQVIASEEIPNLQPCE
jgi:hypothetical protein